MKITNARYIDSVQGKITLLQEKFRSLVNTTIDSNMAKQFLDVVITIVDTLDKGLQKLDKMGIALPTVVGSIAGLVKSLKFQANGGFTNLIAQQRQIIQGAEEATTVVAGQTTQQSQLNAQMREGSAQAKGFWGTLKEGFSSTTLGKGLSNITNAYKENRQNMGVFKSAVQAVKGEMSGFTGKALGAKVAVGALNVGMTALNMAFTSLIAIGISKVFTAISNKINETNDAIEESTNKITTYKDNISNMRGKKESLQEYVKTYDELANKAKRTAEEEEAWINVRKQIASIMGDDWVANYDENGNPILKITDSAEDLVDVLDQAIEREQRLLNQENKKLGNDSTTWMNEQAGWNKGLNKDLAVNALKNENKKINDQLQRNNSDFRNSFLGFLKNYKNSQSQLEKAITEGASNVNEAYAQVQEQNKNIISGLMSDFADDNGFKNLESKLQTQVNTIMGTLDFSQLSGGDKLSFSNAMKKMFDTGAIDEALIKYQKLRDELTKTGDTFTYEKDVKKLIEPLSKVLGVSEDIVKQMVKVPENLQMAQSALDKYLMSFGKRESMLTFDKEADSLAKTYDTYTTMLMNLQTLESKTVNGKQVWEVEPVLDIVNSADLPVELDNLMNEILGDGECTVEDMKFIVDVAKAYTEVDPENRKNLMDALQNEVDRLFPDKNIDVGDFKLSANFSLEKSSKEDIDKAFQSLSQFQGKEAIVATIKPQVQNTDQVEAFASLMDMLKGSDKDIEAFFKANVENLAGLESYNDMVEWLFTHSDVTNEFNINVLGEDTIIATKNAVDNLLNSDDEKDIRVKIDDAVTKGDIQGLINGLNEIPLEKRISVLADIGNALDSIGTVDALKLKEKIVEMYCNSYEVWAQMMAIEGKKIPDKPFTIIANSNIDAKIAEIKQKVQNMKPSFTITGYIEYVQSGGKKKNGHVNSPVFKDYNPNGSFSYSDFTNIGDNPYAVDQVSTMNLASPEPVMQSNAVDTSNISSSYGGISTYASDAFDIRDFIDIGKIETIKTPISLDYQNILDMLEYSIELFKELEYRIQNVTKKTSLLDKQMEKAIGTEKIKYLEQKNKLLEEQQKLQKEYYDSLISERETLQKKLKESGFTFNEEGNMENYEEKLLAMQKEYKRLQDLADKSSKGSSSSSNNTASDKASKYKEELDKLTSLANKYYEIQQSDIYSCEEQWLEMKNTIKENNDEIEKLTREDKLYKFNNAITKINNQFDILKNKLDVVDAKLENANGLNTIKLTEEKLKLLNQQLKKQEELVTNLKQKIPVYQDNLSKYGFKFDIEGNVDNLDEVLNNFQNNEDLEKVNDLVEEYIDLINGDLFDAEKDYIDLQNDIIDLQKDKLDKVKDIEDEITKIIEDEIDKRKDAIEDQYDKEKELIEQRRDEYKKQRDEDDYAKDLKEQQDKIDEINKKIELARRDNSIAGKSKLQDLLEELKDEQDSLNEKIQNKVDDDIDDMFDKQLDALDKKKEDVLQQMEDTYTPQKIAQMVQDAMMTNTFTDLNGNVTNLQDKLIEFAETSGDAIGILGDSIKTELCDNLSIALDYLEDYSKIFNELGLKQLGDINYRGNMKDGSVSKTLNTGDFIFNVDGNMDDKALNDMRNMIKQTLQDIVNKSL